MNIWFVLDFLLILLSGILYFIEPTKRLGVIVFCVSVAIGLVLLVHNQIEKRIGDGEILEIKRQVNELYAEFKAHKVAELEPITDAKNKRLSKNGGALYIHAAVPGVDEHGSFLLDYGDVASPERNRAYLLANFDRTISFVLYDDGGKQYKITSSKSETSNGSHQSHQIVGIWNKEYGDMVLFVDDEQVAKASVKPLNVQPINGQLAIGSNINGAGQGSISVQQVAVFAFNA